MTRRSRPSGPFTAIEIDGETLRVVQTSGSGHRIGIARIGTERLEIPANGESDAAKLGRAVADALQRLRIKPAGVVMGVPRPVVVLRTLTLPSIPDIRELASMVQFQIGKDLPFRLDEAVIDFMVRKATVAEADTTTSEADADKVEPLAKAEVLVAAVKRDVVQFYEEVAKHAGLKLAGLGWLSYANARVTEACRIGDPGQPVALVSLRPDEVNVDVVLDGDLLFSRGGAIHLAPAPEPESTPTTTSESAATLSPQTFVEAAALEAVRSLHSYSGHEPNRPVTKVVVTGATGNEPAVVVTLQQQTTVPCSFLDPAEVLRLPAEARQQAAGSVSTIGLALAANDPEGLPFDFLNPKRPPAERNVQRIRVLAAAAAITFLLISTLGVRTHLINQRQKTYQKLQAQLKEAEKKRPIYRQMQVQADTVSEWLKEARPWLEYYAHLSAILPPSEEIYITSIAMTGKGSIRLSVQARSGEVLDRLDKQLRAAGYDVKPRAISPGTDKHGYDFRSTLELVAPEKIKIDLGSTRPAARPADDASLLAITKKR